MKRKYLIVAIMSLMLLVFSACGSSDQGIQVYKGQGVQHIQFNDNLLELPENLQLTFDERMPRFINYLDENQETFMSVTYFNVNLVSNQEEALSQEELDQIMIGQSRLEDYDITYQGDYRIISGISNHVNQEIKNLPTIIIGNTNGDIIHLRGLFDAIEYPEKKKAFDGIADSIQSFSTALEENRAIYFPVTEYRMDAGESLFAPKFLILESYLQQAEEGDSYDHIEFNSYNFSEPGVRNQLLFYGITEEELSNQFEFDITLENLVAEFERNGAQNSASLEEVENKEYKVGDTDVYKLHYRILEPEENAQKVNVPSYLFQLNGNFYALAAHYGLETEYLDKLMEFIVKTTIEGNGTEAENK